MSRLLARSLPAIKLPRLSLASSFSSRPPAADAEAPPADDTVPKHPLGFSHFPASARCCPPKSPSSDPGTAAFPSSPSWTAPKGGERVEGKEEAWLSGPDQLCGGRGDGYLDRIFEMPLGRDEPRLVDSGAFESRTDVLKVSRAKVIAGWAFFAGARVLWKVGITNPSFLEPMDTGVRGFM
ncbi:hypothetical protein DFJ74DRAFT_710806 [Hyaloraphidium curvatum]|nr:hypothetical protein DFJ74DRAFT_710806 [Hyaloraphidium curvatum]